QARIQFETPLRIGPGPPDGSVFLVVVGIDSPSAGERHAIGPDGEDRGTLHWLPQMVEDASADSSPFFSRITVSILAFPAGGAALRTGWGTSPSARMRAVQPSPHRIVALKPPEVLRVSLNPQVTFFGSLGSNLPAWVTNASTDLPVSASTTLPKTST